jgi:hypothetical protein
MSGPLICAERRWRIGHRFKIVGLATAIFDDKSKSATPSSSPCVGVLGGSYRTPHRPFTSKGSVFFTGGCGIDTVGYSEVKQSRHNYMNAI